MQGVPKKVSIRMLHEPKNPYQKWMSGAKISIGHDLGVHDLVFWDTL